MVKAKVLVLEKLDITEKYRIEIKVLDVAGNRKYKDGIKVSFILIDKIKQLPRLLLDNHEPIGFHIHEELQFNKKTRRKVPVNDYHDALKLFRILVKEIISNEN